MSPANRAEHVASWLFHSVYAAVLVARAVGGSLAAEDTLITVSVIKKSFQPLRFFDVVLRLLPPDPAVLQPNVLVDRLRADSFYLVAKRVFDMVLASVMLVATTPHQRGCCPFGRLALRLFRADLVRDP